MKLHRSAALSLRSLLDRPSSPHSTQASTSDSISSPMRTTPRQPSAGADYQPVCQLGGRANR
jgi:hypothetical protein